MQWKGYLVGDCASKRGVWRKYMIFRTQFLSESPPSIYTQLTATHTPPTDIWEVFLGVRKKERNPSYIKAKSHLTNVPLFPFRIRVNELIRQTFFCTWEHAFSFLDLPGWVFISLLSQTEKNTCTNLLGSEARTAKKLLQHSFYYPIKSIFLLIWLGYQQKVV